MSVHSKSASEQSQIRIFHSAREKKSGMWVLAPLRAIEKLSPLFAWWPAPPCHKRFCCLPGCLLCLFLALTSVTQLVSCFVARITQRFQVMPIICCLHHQRWRGLLLYWPYMVDTSGQGSLAGSLALFAERMRRQVPQPQCLPSRMAQQLMIVLVAYFTHLDSQSSQCDSNLLC